MAAHAVYSFRGVNGQISVPLYKYYSNYDYAKDAINNQRIHLEQPSDYNDIYDSAIFLTEDTLKRMGNTSNNTCRILRTFLPTNYHPALENCCANIDRSFFSVHDAIEYICTFDKSIPRNDLIDQCISGISQGTLLQAFNNKISCFSERNDSLLMWAYYASNAQGVCLGFDVKSDPLLKMHCHKVHYSNHFICDTYGFDYYFRKSEQWSHEQEWRIVCDTTEQYIPTTSLSTLILGCRMPIEVRLEFIALGKEKNLEIYEIKPSTQKYELLLESVL